MKKLLTVMLLLFASMAWGGNFEDGDAAYHKNNYAVAIDEFTLAAQGNAEAQLSLGFMYDKGDGVIQDYTEALKWYKLAAAQGNADAQINLGVMYLMRRGVIQDYVRAHMWFNLAAANGNAAAGVNNRDLIEAKMTSQQVSEAQKLARECQASHFKHCD